MKNSSTTVEESPEAAIAPMQCYMPPLSVRFSGGRTSAFMAKFIKERYPNRKMLFVFANTGKEKEETLIFVDKCDKEFGLNLIWLEADVNEAKGIGTNYKIVDFKTASRNGEPFKAVIKKYGLPSKLYRHCTRELKQVPIDKYTKEILGSKYVTALGIRADEKHRISNDPKKVYPLVEMNIDEAFIRRWWKRQSFDLQLKDYEGNCDLCFLKSKRKKLTLIAENPNIADWWNEMEIEYSSLYQSKFDEYRNLSILDLVELAKQPFRRTIDKEEQRESMPQLLESEFDLEFDCLCKSG